MPCRQSIVGKMMAYCATFFKNHLTGFIPKFDLFLLGFCCLGSWIGAFPFTESHFAQLLLALAGGIPLTLACQGWQSRRNAIQISRQFKWLLEHLLSRLTAGSTLENAFLGASDSLARLAGKRAALLPGIRHLEKQIGTHQPLHLILPQISSRLPGREIHHFFNILPKIRQSGGQINLFVRQQLNTTMEHLAIRQDINAENSQRRTEALLLAIMPFLIAFMLQNPGESLSGGLNASPLASLVMLSAWLTAMAAAVLVMKILNMQIPAEGEKSQIEKIHIKHCLTLKYLNPIAKYLHHIYQNYLPQNYCSRLLQIFTQKQYQQDPQLNYPQSFFSRKTILILASLVPALLIVIGDPALWWIGFSLPGLIAIIQDQQVFRSDRRLQLEYQLEYPLFLILMASLLQSGLSVHVALDICMRAYQISDMKKQTGRTIINQDLLDIHRNMLMGYSVSQILEQTAENCPVADVRSALMLIAKYDRTGSSEILMMIQMQASSCQSLYRSSVRSQLEMHMLSLLIPMILDLVSVIIISILPAALTIYQGI